MNLREYLDLESGNMVKLARLLEIPPAYLWQMAAGMRSVSPLRCVAIETLTDRLVSREDLREDWAEIWPEIRGRLPLQRPPATAASAASA